VHTINKIANRIAQTKFASRAIEDGADLSVFKERPTARNFFGILLICCSYIIGLPVLGLIGALAVSRHEPLLVVIGGPLLLIIAHLIFLTGMVLAGGNYVMVFFRWATRIVLEKLM
jgi:hypothetical protein